MPQRKASRYELVNIGFVNWYLFVVQDIPVYGSIAIVGHNGAGKSAIIDGMQVALTGNSKNAFRLNAAAQERRASERTVKSYCLGTMASADGERVPRTARADAITYILLGFRNSASNREVTVGICLAARADAPDERIEGLFVLKGQTLRAEDVVTRGVDEDGEFVEPLAWSAVSARVRAIEGVDLLVNATADMHVRELCHALSPGGVPIQHRKFLRTLKAGLRFNPETIESATNFVRNFILDGERISLAAVPQARHDVTPLTASAFHAYSSLKPGCPGDEMAARIPPFPKPGAASASPIATYIWLGEAHRKLADLHAAGHLPARRVILEASRTKHQRDLVSVVRDAGGEVVLYPEVAELSAVG